MGCVREKDDKGEKEREKNGKEKKKMITATIEKEIERKRLDTD